MKLKAEHKREDFPWASWLLRIVYLLNTQYSETTCQTPYELVFDQPPRQNIFPDVVDEGQINGERQIDNVFNSFVVDWSKLILMFQQIYY